MYHYHWGQFQSHVFPLWVLLPLSWLYMVGKTPSWADQSVKNHSDFNIWYWYFSKHQMWQLGWFSKTRSHIMFFKTVIYSTKELKNNPVWSLKQYCMRCYVFLNKYSNYSILIGILFEFIFPYKKLLFSGTFQGMFVFTTVPLHY